MQFKIFRTTYIYICINSIHFLSEEYIYDFTLKISHIFATHI